MTEEIKKLNYIKSFINNNNIPMAEFTLRELTKKSNLSCEELIKYERQIKNAYGLTRKFSLNENNIVSHHEKYLIIKAWGYGFWSDVHHVINNLFLAELLGRKACIIWGSNSLYKDENNIDSFSNFFNTNQFSKVQNINFRLPMYPLKWNFNNIFENNINKWNGEYSRIALQYFFSKTEDILVSDFYTPLTHIIPWISNESKYFGLNDNQIYQILFQKYLIPNINILKTINDFYSENMINDNWIGIHARGTDKINESADLDEINRNYFSLIDEIIKLNPTIKLFLITDSNQILQSYSSRYKNILLTTNAVRSNNDFGVHNGNNNNNTLTIGNEILIDSLLATKCNYFIGNIESNVSLAISSLKAWSNGSIFLLGSKNIRGDNSYLFDIT
jgi:hypothetical protein